MNALNVFPVPDGDTGTNMLLTMKSACQEITEENTGTRGRGGADCRARRADGRTRQLGGDPVADSARHGAAVWTATTYLTGAAFCSGAERGQPDRLQRGKQAR